MQDHFEKFIKNITLTTNQRNDGKTKYKGVCEKLHSKFYESEYNGSSKFLFGSYKNKTSIRPISSDQDVDVLFKIPQEAYENYKDQENGPSNLLTKIKNTLKDKYTTTDKISNWGKVVLIEFSQGTHNVELLPAYEEDDGTFSIPNTENGGSRESFDPRSEVDDFDSSNTDSDGLTRDLIKMLKRWRKETSSVSIKSYEITKYAIDLLSDYSFSNYPVLVKDAFDYLNDELSETRTNTALNRSNNALDYINKGDEVNAIDEYRKIFGGSFPKNVSTNKLYDIAPDEEFIEDMFPVLLDSNIAFRLDGKLRKKVNGFRNRLSVASVFPVKNTIDFKILDLSGIELPFSIMRKVRNFGDEALEQGQLRGEITIGGMTRSESTSYKGKHYVECYIIRENVCVAREKIGVPLGGF